MRFGMPRTPVLAALACTLALAACGSSEFETKVVAWCEKGGNKGGSFDLSPYDCACVAGKYGSAFDADQETIFLIGRVEGRGSASAMQKGVEATGKWKKGDESKGLYDIIKVFGAAEDKAQEEIAASCKKS